MKFTIILIFSMVFFSCKGQSSKPKDVPENATYSRKLNLYTESKDGFIQSWYENGNLVMKTQINEVGLNNGIAERYEYKTGKTITLGQYKMAEKSGTWHWNDSDGKAYYEMNFSPGVRKRKFWVPIIEWGNENGAYTRYFPDGRKSEKGEYDGGNRSGDWVKYYPDTKIESKGGFIDDHKVGEWYYYYPDGKKEKIEKFDFYGKLEFRTTYYPNGSIWCQTNGESEPKCN